MQFIDLAAQQQKIRADIEARIKKVLDHGKYVMGPEIAELETALAEFCGTARAVSCSSGTDALVLALMALDVGPGDAVFTTPFTFVATAEAIALLGASPVFVDMDPDTFNMDPRALSRAVGAMAAGDPEMHPLPAGWRSLTPRGVLAVDLFGLPAEYDAIGKIAGQNNLWVVEDAAQAFGATYHGRRACSLAGIGCTSFFPAKPLGGYGDGGMCFTDDPALADKMESLRIHGQGKKKYENVRIGLNARMDTLQAAVLLSKFSLFPAELELRRQVAARYTQALSSSPFVPPKTFGHARSAWAQYSILCPGLSRDKVVAHLSARSIPAAIYYPLPLHLQKAFARQGYKPGDFPAAETAATRILSLPMHPYLSNEDQDAVLEALLSYKE
ncbi:MAG: DegT/DnrJ/EryC1/StrS family aminotransferase [Deltaproteobacteria bacterium]|nr:DegT/DnrJ/EryC1/StrS family aminotransferase [Deltaproteobacteria bacterium]